MKTSLNATTLFTYVYVVLFNRKFSVYNPFNVNLPILKPILF